jgi:deoxyribodipyrimidine photo-lyase
MKKGVALVWFTTDLRLRDNALLHEALQRHELIVPVYCFDWESMQQEQFGFKRMGARRLQFLLESLADLQQSLLALNVHLQVVVGRAEDVIPKIASEYGVSEVFAKKEVGSYELGSQVAVAQALNKMQIEDGYQYIDIVSPR